MAVRRDYPHLSAAETCPFIRAGGCSLKPVTTTADLPRPHRNPTKAQPVCRRRDPTHSQCNVARPAAPVLAAVHGTVSRLNHFQLGRRDGRAPEFRGCANPRSQLLEPALSNLHRRTKKAKARTGKLEGIPVNGAPSPATGPRDAPGGATAR